MKSRSPSHRVPITASPCHGHHGTEPRGSPLTSSSRSAVGRFLGFLVSATLTKACSAADQRARSRSCGGRKPDLDMRKRARIGWRSNMGGCSSASSMAVMPDRPHVTPAGYSRPSAPRRPPDGRPGRQRERGQRWTFSPGGQGT